ncbi:hypothetical protein L1987_60476 [Smallanthus sonchifolius]|uniref:Uncharacterized protein n=1 Tax=Smallanthus sonchifolius TaxID=185202 RepID=A0ACB9D8D7_9ASTR|nr:hypothetical protein L1987_60476 [Smallanthus sonchifolius]
MVYRPVCYTRVTGELIVLNLEEPQSVPTSERKKTLLKDYERSDKSSVFVDKRIGEQNEDFEEFDKAILRSRRI